MDRCGRRLLAELARVVHAAVRGRVDLDDVEVLAFADGDALLRRRRTGSGVGPFSQLTILARIRAVDVLPVPRGPQNRNAWCRRFSRMAPGQGADHVLLPQDLAGACGRYRR